MTPFAFALLAVPLLQPDLPFVVELIERRPASRSVAMLKEVGVDLRELKMFMAPDVISIGSGNWLVGGRRSGSGVQSTIRGRLDQDGSWTNLATLPSGGDFSDPGFAGLENTILGSYDSSHEGPTSNPLPTRGPT
jgi:hypothetical protein